MHGHLPAELELNTRAHRRFRDCDLLSPLSSWWLMGDGSGSGAEVRPAQRLRRLLNRRVSALIRVTNLPSFHPPTL